MLPTQKYLLSVGFRLPLVGMTGHRYFRVKRLWKYRARTIGTGYIVISCYKKLPIDFQDTV